MSEPTFFILKFRLPPSNTPHMLGRLVANPLAPLERYTPAAPEELLPQHFSSATTDFTEEQDARLVLRKVTDQSLQTRLLDILNVSRSDLHKESLTMTSKSVRTRRLANYDVVFGDLLDTEEFQKRLPALLPIGGKAYFVTGIMTCVDAAFNHAKSSKVGRGAGVDVPVVNIMTAATGGVSLPIDLGGVGFDVDQSRTEKWNLSATSTGEEIFAVEYRIVQRKWGGMGKKAMIRNDNLRLRGGISFSAGSGSDEELQDEDAAHVEKSELALDLSSLDPERLGKVRGKKAVMDESSRFLYYPDHTVV